MTTGGQGNPGSAVGRSIATAAARVPPASLLRLRLSPDQINECGPPKKAMSLCKVKKKH